MRRQLVAIGPGRHRRQERPLHGLPGDPAAIFRLALTGSADAAGVQVLAVVAPRAGALPLTDQSDSDADGAQDARAISRLHVRLVAVLQPAALSPDDEITYGKATDELTADGIDDGARHRVRELILQLAGQKPDHAPDRRSLDLIRVLVCQRGGAANARPPTTGSWPTAVTTSFLFRLRGPSSIRRTTVWHVGKRYVGATCGFVHIRR
ncbi:hypothetical protein ACFVW5_04950 [Streptomyces sp. NPDC058232]|uniref:hypothetical protein n=1 Tax=Streptomyces sp. NPDC058232 TaxID=3346393 RepID=UPI0036E6DF95